MTAKYFHPIKLLLLSLAVSVAPFGGHLAAAAPAPAATTAATPATPAGAVTPGAGTSGGNAASCSSPTGNPANRCLGNGNPINLSTGNKYQRDVDLPALPGVMGLEIVRHYNSLFAMPGVPNGILGRGWRLSYEVDLYAVGSTIQIVEPDGHRVIFSRDPLNPSHCSTPDPANGSITIRRTDRGDAYLWTRGDGAVWDFNEQQKLVQITALTGESVNLQYDPDGLLLQVTDPQGRRLQLTYLDRAEARSGTRFSGVQSITSPVGRFDYGFGSTLPKGATINPVMTIANLVSVTSPSTDVRQYHYEDPLHPTLLTGISVTGNSDRDGSSKAKESSGNGKDGSNTKNSTSTKDSTSPTAAKTTTQRLATFGYQADGRAILSTHANDVDRVTLRYPDRTTSILTNSLGQTTVYRHADIAGEYRLLEARGPGCRLCDAANVRFSYDQLGRTIDVTRLASDGTPIQTTHTTRDYAGRPLTVGIITYSNGKPNPQVLQQRYEYGPGNIGLPTLIARSSVIAGREAQTRITYNAANQPLTVTDIGWAPAVTLNAASTAGSNAGSNAAAEAAPTAVPTRVERTTIYRYAQIGRRSVLAQIDGPLANGPTNSPADSDITRFDWDAQGANIIAATTPGNFKSQFSYDEAGRLVQVANGTGERTTMTYDVANQLTAVTQNGVTQRYQYDAMGRQTEVGVDAGEGYRALARFGFDEANRSIWSASHLGILNSRRYDTESKLLRTTVESSRFKQTQAYEYDATGRLVASIDAQGGTRTLHWNAQGLPDAVTNALGRTQQFHYDVHGRLDKVTAATNDFDVVSTTRTTPAATRFERDAHGNTVTVIAPNGAITRTLTDDFGRVVAINSADAGFVTRSYDVAGRLIASTDANGNAASYAYDVADRIVRQNVTDTHANDPHNREVVTGWTYADKRLVAIDHPNQSERYAYDKQGNLISTTVVLTLANGAHATSVTRYRYDQQGQLLATTLPDGSTLNYRRNGQHQIVAIERSRIDTEWLAWLLPTQTIVKDLQRDLIGLRQIVFGNGIEAHYQRSKEGALARIVVRRADGLSKQPALHALLEILGISPAQASTVGNTAATTDKVSITSTANTPASNAIAALPGALSAAQDLAALIDHRYLWDLQGNLLYTQSVNRISNYAYDAQDRLIAAGTTATMAPAPAQGVNISNPAKPVVDSAGKTAIIKPATTTFASYSRYFYDNTGNRILAQEAVSHQDDTTSHTIKTNYAAASNRWNDSHAIKQDAAPVAIRYDASGQPERIGNREYVWNALGKLTKVRQEQRTLASYRYNNSGQRISKTVQGHTTYYLYENRQLSAELDEQGRITRQYVYLADQPVAIIDTPQSSPITAPDNASTLAQIGSDLATAAKSWFGSTATIVYLHANHLGATELVTDAQGDAIWRAEYQPYGKAKTVTAATSAETSAETSASAKLIKNTSDASLHPSTSKPEFQLNLRLPGQYEDAETGLYYNDYRYYDPARGQYLTPDPIGLRGGLNSYAYVEGNPLKYVDPLGLILFAFDGSNNSNPPPVNKTGAQDDFSNVYKFYLAYDADLNGPAWYMNGVGRNDPESGINATFADGANAYTARARVDYMLGKLDNYMATTSFAPGEQVNIDIVGFSRGAAMGRDFSNRVAERMRKNAFEKSGACVQIRFMGLWDTVAQFGENGISNGQWQLAIPPEAQHVFHAVALNENRYLFPGESIGRGTQRGFIGSHADIGGSYGTGDLSDVALNWIVEEAKKSGVKMKAWDAPGVDHSEWGKVSNPVLHDKSIGTEDRSFCLRKNNEYFATNCQRQRQATPGGMTWGDTQMGNFITRYDKPTLDADGSSKIIGEIDMKAYGAWLKQNYGLAIP